MQQPDDDKLGTVPILPISLGMKASTFINFAKASDCSLVMHAAAAEVKKAKWIWDGLIWREDAVFDRPHSMVLEYHVLAIGMMWGIAWCMLGGRVIYMGRVWHVDEGPSHERSYSKSGLNPPHPSFSFWSSTALCISTRWCPCLSVGSAYICNDSKSAKPRLFLIVSCRQWQCLLTHSTDGHYR